MKRAANRWVPERQIILRTEHRTRAVIITQRFQLLTLAAVFAFVTWSLYATVSVVFNGTIIAAKDREIGSVRLANASLQEDMHRAEERFGVITNRLEAKHAYLVGLMERTGTTPPAAVAANTKTVRSVDPQGDQLTASRDAVKRQIAELDDLNKKLPGLDGGLATNSIEDMLHDHGRVQAESSRLKARLDSIEERLGELHVAQQSTMTQLARRALSNLDEVRDVIAGLGLDADRVLGRNVQSSPQGGVGGPFIPAGPSTPSPVVQVGIVTADRAVERWEGVQRSLRALPLGAPVDQVSVMSPFGRRVDPFNGLAAFHSGMDLGGTMGTPIHATAPGRVSYVGTDGSYGRMIEIDHGQGLSTRYAHLSRFMVKPGERVHYGQVIGLMGMTGRATGVHVHYEVLLDGKPRDPAKFIQAGSYVFVQR
jgi:murein DD-endopeptidase MepM/ murein hydrolase activator NlpD